MKKVRSTWVIAAMVIVTLVLSVSTVFAHGGRGPGGPLGRLLRGLDLAPEQKQQIGVILKGHAEEARAGGAAVMQAREHLVEVTTGKAFDESAVRGAYRAMASAQEGMTVLRAKTFSEVMAVLTPEQQSKISERLAKFGAKMKRFAERRQEHMHEWVEHLQ